MKTKAFTGLAMLCCIVACGPDIDVVSPDPLFPEQSTFKTSLFIRITSAAGLPLAGTKIKMGDKENISDSDGWLLWQDVQVGSSAYLKVEKNGYFKSSRRFYPSPGGAPQYIRIILEPDNYYKYLQANDGGRLKLQDGFVLDFPANAIEDVNGREYHGEVRVATQVLNIDDPMMSYKMPGDLTGINKSGTQGQLSSLGMIRVELSDYDGNRLQLRAGATVHIEIPVADSRKGLVPASMPLWYFEESVGIWKEEGQATLEGDHYVGAVHHFSFWNCDDWTNAINWRTTLKHDDGSPVQYGQVCLTIKNLNTMRCSYVDQNGEVYGRVAGKEEMSIDIYNECNELVVTKTIGPYDNDVIEPAFILSKADNQVSISGHAFDCSNGPLKHGSILMNYDQFMYRPNVDTTGFFTMNIISCDPATLSIRAFDLEKGLISDLQYFDPAPAIMVDSLKVCKSSETYLWIKTASLDNPVYSERIQYHSSGEDCLCFIDSKGGQHNFWVCIKNETPGDYPGTSAYVRLQFTELTSGDCTSFNMHLWEYGDYIKASFEGELATRMSDTIVSFVPFTGEFRVKRD